MKHLSFRRKSGSALKGANEPTRLRIVNLNTWVGILPRKLVTIASLEPPGYKERRYQALLHELRERQPDFITLQECVPLPYFTDRLASDLDYDVIYQVATAGLRVGSFGLPVKFGQGEGLAILGKKRHNMKHLARKRLSGLGVINPSFAFQVGHMRWGLAALATVNNRPLIIANTHIRYAFESFETFGAAWSTLYKRRVVNQPTPPPWVLQFTEFNQRQRNWEIRKLAKWTSRLRAHYDAPLILGGDFNLDTHADQMLRFVTESGLTNSMPLLHPELHTWVPGDNPNIDYSLSMTWQDGQAKSILLQLMALLDSRPQTPDHILSSPEFILNDGGLAFDKPHHGAFASDHFGVWLDATLS